MSDAFFNAVQSRRSHYGLSKVSTIPDKKLQLLVMKAVKHAPSPFNVQSGRAVIVLGKQNDRLWDIAKTGFLKTLDNEGAIKLFTKKMDEYAAGYGTVLFFEDTAVIQAMADQKPG
jgi:predicted oxidoreductase (fatty acid repression mutant protein)